jgi:hypothetical protein
MNKAKQLLADLDYLEKAGLTTEQLRSLHHWSDRRDRAERVSFAIARKYFAKEMTLKKNNVAFADRLRLVADLHQRSFAALVELALAKYPL